MNIIFEISGGIGKCVIATAVCEAIKKQYPDSKLIVVSGYSDVFLNNPNVYRAYNYGLISYFYEEFIEDKDFLVFKHDPYNETSFLKQNESIIKTWCEMFDIAYNGELPKIYLTEREKTFFAHKFHSDKPILLLQTNGGGSQELKYSWSRDIPFEIATKVVEEFKDIYNVVHIKRDDQLVLENTIPVSDNFRALAVLISLSRKRLFMDSFAQHTSAALGLPSTVCWIANKPIVFGYEIHDNIVSNPFTIKPELKNAYLNKFDIGGNLIEFPYNNESEIFNVDDIIKSIKKQK
jgi:hypothetical protein